MTFSYNIIFAALIILLQNKLLHTYAKDFDLLNYNKDSVIRHSIVGLLITIIFTSISFVVYNTALYQHTLSYISLLVFALIIIVIIQITEIAFKKLSYIFEIKKETFIIVTTNSCMLCAFTSIFIISHTNFIEIMLFSVGTFLLYTILAIIFLYFLPRINKIDVPEYAKGLPIELFAISIMAFCLFGFF